MNTTIALMTQRIAQSVLEKHPPDLLIEVSKQSCAVFDFYRADELVEIGREAAVRALEKTGL